MSEQRWRGKLILLSLATLLALLAAPFEVSAQQLSHDADTLVLCSSKLQTALKPWVEYRQQQGHKIAVRFSKPSAKENKQLISEYAAGQQLKNLLLVGDSGDRQQDPEQRVPAELVPAKVNVMFGSEPKIASDNPYADLDGDGVPELTVGRITADTPEELTDTIKRIIRYETEADGQLWQRQINLIAGVGGFGRLVDTVVENATRQILTDLVPAGYQTSMTYGSWTSPFCPSPKRFSETAIGRFNEGCLFWVYCGHGQRDALDRIRVPKQNYRILDTKNVQQLNCQQGSPIAICLSCYTGAHDGEQDCLAEHMMRQPNGPVAVVCGSRVTMPYAMSILSVEMMNEYFRGQSETLGQLMLTAKQRMIEKPDQDKYRMTLDVLGKALSPLPGMLDEECREHLQLMQLLGDPLLRLKRPQRLGLAIMPAEPNKAEGEIASFVAGDRFTVSGKTDRPGSILIELAYQRGRLRHRHSVRHEYDSSEDALAKIHQEYLQAHDSVCFRRVIKAEGGTFQADLQIPNDCSGKCDVRAILLGTEVAIDSVPVRVRPLRIGKK